MAQKRPPLGELLSRLVGGRGTRGLSGDADRVLPMDAIYDFFADGLRKHEADGDLVEDPALLWSTASMWARGGGLEDHLRNNRGDAVLGFTDVLVIVSAEDWRKGLRRVSQPWGPSTARLLEGRVRAWSAEVDLPPLFPERPVRVRVLPDGAPELGGGTLGLEAGAFVTGLLPNQYAGPLGTSKAVVAFHLSVPGAWEGYREVGRLYSDQMLFTLGNHWLDNFQHPSLQIPAMYRLQRYGDGSFVHVLNPEIADEVRIVREDTVVSSVHGHAPNVLALRHNSGAALGWLVLALVDELGPTPTVELPELSLDEDVPGSVPSSAPSSGPSTGPVVPPRMTGHRTVVPVDMDDRMATLRERAVLLQKVHFSRFMVGYDVYIGANGQVGTRMEQPAATVSVRAERIGLTVHQPGLRLDAGAMRPGQTVELEGDHTIGVMERELRFRDLRGVYADGWPYLAEIRRPGGAAHLVFGATHRIGRQPRCAVRLPDQPHNGNIVWRSKYADAPVIRSRNGEIPKSRFSIDSIMVATEHAALDLSEVPRVRSLARHCHTFVRRGDKVISLAPSTSAEGVHELVVEHGDELLIGNCAFRLRWPIAGRSQSGDEMLTAEELAAAVDDLEHDEPEDARPPQPSRGAAPGLTDLPAAGGFGERGPRPPRVPTPDDVPESAPPMMLDAAPPMMLDEAPDAAPPMMLDEAPDAATPMMLEDPPDPSAAPPMMREDPPDPSAAPPRVAPPMLPADLDLQARPTVQASPTANPSPWEAPSAASGPVSWVSAEPALGAGMGPARDPSALPGDAPPPPLDLSDASVSFMPADDAPSEPIVAVPATPSSVPTGDVVVVEEDDWQLELGRRARLHLDGWMVAREVRVGNHRGADVIIPENRSVPEQTFAPADYFTVACRGGRSRIHRSSEGGEAQLRVAGVPQVSTEAVDDVVLDIVRRDAFGQEDFRVVLSLQAHPGLPDPRAHILALAGDNRMVGAMFALGLPLNAPRTLRLGPITCALTWTGDNLELADYADDYQREDGGWWPFFVQQGGGPFRTVPEDGRLVVLAPGDRILVGAAIYRLVAD